jgi:hypothetical protein
MFISCFRGYISISNTVDYKLSYRTKSTPVRLSGGKILIVLSLSSESHTLGQVRNNGSIFSVP